MGKSWENRGKKLGFIKGYFRGKIVPRKRVAFKASYIGQSYKVLFLFELKEVGL